MPILLFPSTLPLTSFNWFPFPTPSITRGIWFRWWGFRIWIWIRFWRIRVRAGWIRWRVSPLPFLSSFLWRLFVPSYCFAIRTILWRRNMACFFLFDWRKTILWILYTETRKNVIYNYDQFDKEIWTSLLQLMQITFLFAILNFTFRKFTTIYNFNRLSRFTVTCSHLLNFLNDVQSLYNLPKNNMFPAKQWINENLITDNRQNLILIQLDVLQDSQRKTVKSLRYHAEECNM